MNSKAKQENCHLQLFNQLCLNYRERERDKGRESAREEILF